MYMGNWKDTSEEDKKKFIDNGYAITYGELTLDGLTEIMNHNLNDPIDLNDKVFVDLGSGNGNVVINVMKNFEGLYKGIGIELSKTRYNTAIKKLEDESKEIQKKIHFSCNDILEKINKYVFIYKNTHKECNDIKYFQKYINQIILSNCKYIEQIIYSDNPITVELFSNSNI